MMQHSGTQHYLPALMKEKNEEQSVKILPCRLRLLVLHMPDGVHQEVGFY